MLLRGMKLRTPSDLFLWLVVIFPACGAIAAILQTRSLSIVLLISGFAMMECGRTPGAKLSRAMARMASGAVIAAVLSLSIGFYLMFEPNPFEKPADPLPVLALVQGASPAPPAAGTFPEIEWTGVPEWAKRQFQTLFFVIASIVFLAVLGQSIRPWLQLALSAFFAALVYPIFGRWTWGGGWLQTLGFLDFAGSTVVYSIASWSALPFLVARRWSNRHATLPQSSVDGYHKLWLYLTGAILVWFGGAGLELLGLLQPSPFSDIAISINLAVLAGGITASLLSWLIYFAWRVQFTFIGSFAGSAAMSACVMLLSGAVRSPSESVLIGAAAGSLATLSAWFFERVSLPDRLNIIPAFAVGGAWGTLYVGLTSQPVPLGTIPPTLSSQVLGIAVAFLWPTAVFGPIAFLAYRRGWLNALCSDQNETAQIPLGPLSKDGSTP